jgi:hypothetical protein
LASDPNEIQLWYSKIEDSANGQTIVKVPFFPWSAESITDLNA